MELDNKLLKKTSARDAMERKFLRRRKYLNVLSIKVLHMVKNTFSMENLMLIQIKKQVMLLLLLMSKSIKHLKEREQIYSLRKPFLYKMLSLVLISLSII
jgi:hypothetical protein